MIQVIKKIKEKPELSDLPNSLVKEVLENYLKKNKLKIPENKKQLKLIVKEIRAELRKYTGRFQIKDKKRRELLEKNKIQDLLKTHSSTRERINQYDTLKNLIKKLGPKSILDLGCGLNPIAISKSFPKIKYFVYDIKGNELKLIDYFFKKNKISGQTFLKDIKSLKKFPKTDLTLILKTLDIIETKNHDHAREILKKLKSKNIIVSFSTKTLSGKPMRFTRRLWFENILESLGKKFKTKKIDNEIFYIM